MLISKERDFLIRRWTDLFDLDWYVLGPVLVLLTFSLLLLKSAVGGMYFSKQFIFLFFALLISSCALLIRIKFWEEHSWWIYGVNIFLLLFVLVKGTIVMGSQRWISLGPIHIQPSEIAKIAMIISLASWYSKHPIKNYFDLFISASIVGPPFLLIFKQPDLGTSLTYLFIFLGMAYWAGATATQLLILVSPIISLITNATGKVLLHFGTVLVHEKMVELTITSSFVLFIVFILFWLIIDLKPWKSPWLVLAISGVISLNIFIGFIRPLLWNLLHAYQQRRLTIFLNPESDPLGAGYHIVQSLLAIGNGGFLGYGWQMGKLTKGNYVPAQHTDFIYSIAGEEFGFIGASIIIIMFLSILLRALYIAYNTNDDFSSLLAIGIFAFFSFHVFINIGMTIGLMPITGVPLPLLSYGGSALLVDLFSVLLLISISWRTLPKKIF